jgi:hypothetical protein
MALREKIHATNIERGEGVTSYLTRITQVIYELTTIGDIIPEEEMVRITLNARISLNVFGKQWDVFFKCVVGREKMPAWESIGTISHRKRSERGLNVESKKINLKMKTTLPWQQRARGRARRIQRKEPLQDRATRRSLTPTKSSDFIGINLGIFPPNIPTGRHGKPKKQMATTTDMDAFA